MDWLWQGVVAHGVAELCIVAGAVLVAFLKRKVPAWGDFALYGVIAAAMLAIVWFVFTGRAVLSTQQPQTTVENVEGNIRAWADTFGLAVSKNPPSQDAYFSLVVTLKDKLPIEVVRLKEREHYLVYRTPLVVAPEHQAMFAKLDKDQLGEITEEIILELAKTKMGYSSDTIPPKVTVTKSAPITSSLAEDSFAASLDEMDAGVALARAAIVVALNRHRLDNEGNQH